MSYLASYYLIGGILSGPQGSRHGTLVPYEAFKTKDIWIVVATVTEPFWEGLCVALGLEELVLDERFKNSIKRLDNHDELIPILQEAFLEKTAAQWLELLQEADVPCAPVNTLDRAFSDPQVLARNMIPELFDPRLGKFKLAGNPVKASRTEEVFQPPPRLGGNTEEVLKQLLGYSDDKIKTLLDEKVIGVKEEEDNGE